MRTAHGHGRRADPRPLALILLLLALLAFPPSAGAQEQVAICHATGDPAAPFSLIEIATDDLGAHLEHEEDIVPAPDAGCPVAAQATPTPAYGLPTVTATPVPLEDDGVQESDIVPPDSPAPRPPRDVAAPTSGTAEPLAASAPAIAIASAPLPATGAEVWLTGLFGLSFLVAGAGLRLLSRRSA
jgi:hypothetical protein